MAKIIFIKTNSIDISQGKFPEKLTSNEVTHLCFKQTNTETGEIYVIKQTQSHKMYINISLRENVI